MKRCAQCNGPVSIEDRFCENCGFDLRSSQNQTADFYQKNGSVKGKISTEIIKSANKRIQLKNSQMPIAKVSWVITALMSVILLMSYLEIITIHPALLIISFFVLISAFVVGFMFKGRAKKLQSLIDGDNLIASWTMDLMDKRKYTNNLFRAKKTKNNALFVITSVLMVVIFGLFILFIEESDERLYMVLTGLGILLVLGIVAFGFPYYYKWVNLRKDGHVLIGAKYAYVNGYFHNWDYPLSGLQSIKIINDPFEGILIMYYYTDRTLRHTEGIEIPTTAYVDVDALIKSIKAAN